MKKGLGEIRGVGKAAGFSDLGTEKMRLAQQTLGLVDADAADLLSHPLRPRPGDMLLAHVCEQPSASGPSRSCGRELVSRAGLAVLLGRQTVLGAENTVEVCD